ncbi:AraC family transcriptional regulator [Komagataeibacter sucrofermentans]|uniref:AraC family transcriptional regulator n=1 Tax=Komagataeibacter sucrofermentans TaxID=1053551 RepID=UPI001FC9E7CA
MGSRTLRYDPATYFVMSVDLAAVGALHPSEEGHPYLAIMAGSDPPSPGFPVAPITPELLDAGVCLLRLMEHLDEITALAPAYERERSCSASCRDRSTGCCATSPHLTPPARAGNTIWWTRENFASPLRVSDLADMAALNTSAQKLS